MMGKDQSKTLSVVLILGLLGLSHMLSSDAVPLSRALLISAQDQSMTEAENQATDNEGMMMTEEGFINGRMEIEVAKDDYQSGPNKSHDPKTPAGKS